MKSFYEKYRDDDGKFHLSRNGNHQFPAHFHNNLEIFLMDRGGYEVTLGEARYDVTDGCVLVIDSYEIHSYGPCRAEKDKNDCVVMIPYKYLGSFNARRKNMRIDTPLVKDGALCKELLRLTDEYILQGKSEGTRAAAVELFLALLGERLEFSETKAGDERALVRKILSFIQENYRGDVSRGAIARALGYTEAHISRVFHRYMHTGISEYVNRLRLEYMERLKREGDTRTTIELIYEAGFKSQQTYYRVKKKSESV